MIETVGIAGALLLGICAIPQMILSIFQGHADGISNLFLLSWFVGEILMLIYCVSTLGTTGPLFYNYLANVLMLSVIVRYKYIPRR